MAAILSPLRVPLQALLVSFGGVGLAWLYFDGSWYLALVAVLLSIGAGALLDAIGQGLLPDKPVESVYFLDGWLLMPLAIAMLAAAVIVVVTVELTLPETAELATKKLVGGFSTGITTFLTAAFVSWTSDDKGSTLAEHVEHVFQSHYQRPGEGKPGTHTFRSNSNGERWVFAEEVAGIEGWGQPARLKRAKGIAEELRTGTSDP